MISREELYQLVWSKPMTRVAEQFAVSGTYMARVCALLNVPRPARGYWAKLAVGKAPPPEPLPDAKPGDPLSWSNDGEHRPPPKPHRPRGRRPGTEVRVPRTRIHTLIRGAKEHFENGRAVEDGAYLKPYKRLLVDVTASKAGLDKALGFANDLFNALESVGYRVVLTPPDQRFGRAEIDEREIRKPPRNRYYHSGLWSPYRPTVVCIGSVAIGLAIVEMSASVLLRYVRGTYIREADYIPPKPSGHAADHTWTTTRDLPSARLRLVAYSPYGRVDWSADWQETSKASLRPALKEIVDAVHGFHQASSPGALWRVHEVALNALDRRQAVHQHARLGEPVARPPQPAGDLHGRWSDAEGIVRRRAEGCRPRVGAKHGNRHRVQRLALSCSACYRIYPKLAA